MYRGYMLFFGFCQWNRYLSPGRSWSKRPAVGYHAGLLWSLVLVSGWNLAFCCQSTAYLWRRLSFVAWWPSLRSPILPAADAVRHLGCHSKQPPAPLHTHIYTLSKKTLVTFLLDHNFGKYCPILIILSLLQSEVNYDSENHKIYHHTSNVPVHYLVNWTRMYFVIKDVTVKQVTSYQK